MSTEYTFDGLDEWEKNLAQVIDQQYPEEFKQKIGRASCRERV